MQGRSLRFLVVLVLLMYFSLAPLNAQTTGSAVSSQSVSVPNVIRFSGRLPVTNGSLRIAGVTFALYRDQTGGSSLWIETQNVRVDASGQFSALIGSSRSEGIPIDLFVANEPRWIGVKPEGQDELPRILLVSVPYALKAGDAETLGGLPASAFLQINNSVSGSTTTSRAAALATPKAISPTGTTNFVAKWLDSTNLGNSIMFDSGTAVGIGTTSPAATLDVNGSAVFRGFATLFATALNNGPTFRFKNVATPKAADWTFGVPGIANSTSMWIYDNVNQTAPFQIEQGAINHALYITKNGSIGVGTASPATTLDVNGSAVFRGFATLYATALNNGPTFRFKNAATPKAADWTFGVPGIANSTSMWIYDNVNQTAPFQIEQGAITNAFYIRKNGNVGIGTSTPTSPLDVAGVIHTTGGVKFNDNTVQTTAAVTQTVADGRYLQLTGGTLTGGLTGTAFAGSGAGLTNVNAALLNGNASTAFEFVANKNASNGYAGLDANSQIAKAQAPATTVFNDQDNIFTAGKQDSSAATATLPVQSVLSANTPATCVASKELLIKTDATPGQQLFICNASGNGWAIVSDGTVGTITGVTAGNGLQGGGTTGTVSLSIDSTKVVTSITAGTGITASGGTGNVTVGLDQTFTDGRYAKLSGQNSFVGNQIITGTVTTSAAINAGGIVSGSAINSATKYQLAGNTILSTLGSGNLFVGIGVDPVNTSGHDNVMAGSLSGNSNTTGYSNSFYGSIAGYSNVDGYYNTFLGEGSGYNNSSAHDNVFTGFVAGYTNTTGIGNTALGSNSGYYNSTGSNNTFVGFLAGGFVNNTGSENIYVGHNAGSTAAVESNTIRIGDNPTISKAFMAGIFGTTVGNDGISVLVDSNGQLGTILSSRRFKENIRPMADLSTGLLKLNPVAFYYKPDVDKNETRQLQYGLIAEEVAKVYPDLVVYDKEGKPYTVKYQYLTPMLLNELQKQHEVIVAQQQQADAQREEIKTLQARLDRLEKLLEEKAK